MASRKAGRAASIWRRVDVGGAAAKLLQQRTLREPGRRADMDGRAASDCRDTGQRQSPAAQRTPGLT